MAPPSAPPVELVSLLESSPEPLALFGRDYRILAANAAYLRPRGEAVAIVGHTCYEVSHGSAAPCDQSGATCPLADSLRSGQRERTVHLHHTRDGESYESIELTPIRDASGAVTYFLERLEQLPVMRGAMALEELVGRSAAFTRLVELVARVAPTDTTVQLEGESGTGKEVVARAIHDASPRARRPFVVVDCSGFPETLFESELFGHERGAFTGAASRKHGLVESANGGTLFLDEVGDIPLVLQVKLLRFIETGTYRRVGGTELQRADVRIVSATNRHLERLVAEGRFRQDLYYRLATFPIPLPPLRDRRSDIPLLVTALLKRVARHRSLEITPEVLDRLAAYDFPGNIRELRNVLERASLLCDGEIIGVEHLPAPIAQRPVDACRPRRPPAELAGALHAAMLDDHQTRRELARRLGMSERTLYRRLAKARRA
jgi:DNA-binding NtrC family response regulator